MPGILEGALSGRTALGTLAGIAIEFLDDRPCNTIGIDKGPLEDLVDRQANIVLIALFCQLADVAVTIDGDNLQIVVAMALEEFDLGAIQLPGRTLDPHLAIGGDLFVDIHIVVEFTAVVLGACEIDLHIKARIQLVGCGVVLAPAGSDMVNNLVNHPPFVGSAGLHHRDGLIRLAVTLTNAFKSGHVRVLPWRIGGLLPDPALA